MHKSSLGEALSSLKTGCLSDLEIRSHKDIKQHTYAARLRTLIRKLREKSATFTKLINEIENIITPKVVKTSMIKRSNKRDVIAEFKQLGERLKRIFKKGAIEINKLQHTLNN
jgi:hypothetical protein